MPAPLDWVETIFTKLTLVYGSRFMAQYAGMNPEHVRGMWAHELDGIRLEAVTYGLSHLPAVDFPPNVLQFRAICTRMPEVQRTPALPGPPVDPGRVARVLGRLRELGQRTQRDPKAWARKLRRREELGDSLSITQKAMWRAGLADELRAERAEEQQP
jgi:hypothetical protein